MLLFHWIDINDNQLLDFESTKTCIISNKRNNLENPINLSDEFNLNAKSKNVVTPEGNGKKM